MEISIFLSYARSGGTIINRCLGAMENVVILSEINQFGCGGGHPLNTQPTIKDQAYYWYGYEIYGNSFFEKLLDLSNKVERDGKHLIVRDWTYIYFNQHTSLPKHSPPYNFALYEESKKYFDKVNVFAIVRDPVDVWVSLGKPNTNSFFEKYNHYLNKILEYRIPYIKYEDFATQTQTNIQLICNYCNLKYSDKWKDFPYFLNVHGDVAPNKKGFLTKNIKILYRGRKQIKSYEVWQLSNNLSFIESCKNFNYPIFDNQKIPNIILFISYLNCKFSLIKKRSLKKEYNVIILFKKIFNKIKTIFNNYFRIEHQNKKFKKITITKQQKASKKIVNSKNLFSSNSQAKLLGFPEELELILENFPKSPSSVEIDIVIGTYNNSEFANVVAENFLNLENQSNIHIWFVETSGNPHSYEKLKTNNNISKIYLNTQCEALIKSLENKLYASNGAAISAQIGSYFSESSYLFFSHTDMLACQPNFLSYLKSALDSNTSMISFQNRGLIPFSAGTLYNRQVLNKLKYDWLPKYQNPYKEYNSMIFQSDWIDAGEEIVYESLKMGYKVKMHQNVGGSHFFYNNRIAEELRKNSLNYQNLERNNIKLLGKIPEQIDFNKTYFDLNFQNLVLTKSFDNSGNMIFLHGGRSNKRLKDITFRELSNFFTKTIIEFQK